MYLPKYLANCGICSRRKAVEIVKNKEIIINGKIVDDVTYIVEKNDSVKYKNKILKPQMFRYILLNKPKGFVTTLSDEKGRKTVIDLIKLKTRERVYPVGRLDINTTGVLLLTNDGDLTQQLAHPKYEIFKKYLVTLDKDLVYKDFEKLKKGIKLFDGFIKIDSISYPKKKIFKDILVKIHSGKNRIIKRIFEYLGYRVKKLDRVSFAGLTKKNLRLGEWRFLTQKEIDNLKN